MAACSVVDTYLDLLDAQREAAFAALDAVSDEQIWQRPAPKEWCIGEILNHNTLVIASILPFVRFAWWAFRWWGRLRRGRPYQTDTHDVYREETFPMWVGFVWTPRHNPRRPVPLEQLKAETRGLHQQVRDFYTGKDEAVLGHVSLYDPLIGSLNLIVCLRVGLYHDQLHYDDVIKMARVLRGSQRADA